MQFRLTRALRQGTIDNSHAETTGRTTITLDCHGETEPVVIELEGDMDGPLRGRSVSVYGSIAPPEDMEATAAFVAHLRANASGWVHRVMFDDDYGFELQWRDARHAVIGSFRGTHTKRREG